MVVIDISNVNSYIWWKLRQDNELKAYTTPEAAGLQMERLLLKLFQNVSSGS